MANFKYFNGDRELTSIFYDGRKAMGRPVDVEPRFIAGAGGWFADHIQADRVVEYKRNPSRHECDARCLNATGRVMKCECACGGKNHGRGSVVCEAA